MITTVDGSLITIVDYADDVDRKAIMTVDGSLITLIPLIRLESENDR